MRIHLLLLGLAAASLLSAANPFQPTIAPNGVVNAASNFSPQYANYGIARGSMFLVFGSALGPVNLVSATNFPLPTTDGLAGTRVLISIGGYTASCPMIYTSLTQVAAIMPSNAPEGDASLVVSYQNLASTSVGIRIVHSAFGIFTRNQAGSGPAIVQNFISQTSTPLNSLVSSATPGQTVILWGTGLGPAIGGDETAGPLPGSLPFLDSLYVGGLPANVRYVGRSGCCAGVDEIVFDVPSGASGCYVPVAAVTSGIVSNFGTISVAASGKECDDPLTFRAASLQAAERSGTLRSGQVGLTGTSAGEIDFSGNFFSTDLNTVLGSTSQLVPPTGSCYAWVSRTDLTATHPGNGLNAGDSITVNGPPGLLTAANSSSGGYFMSKSPANLSQGPYAFAGRGGSDVGPFTTTVNLAAPLVWTNASAYSGVSIPLANPLVFNWTGADPAGYVTVQVSTANAIYNSVLQCTAAPSAGTFTVSSTLMHALFAGPVTLSLSSSASPASFTATGLDASTITATTTASIQTTLQPPIQ
jgi:uncharacterized protein (TIGR03437 family)